MRNVIAAAVLLFPTAAMAATFTSYAPVHVAPMVHVAPVIHVAPVHVAPVVHAHPGLHVHQGVRPAHAIGRAGSHQRLLPVAVYTTSAIRKKCADQKSDSKGCAKK